MLWTIIAILLALYLVGLIGNIGGSLVHALLLIALVLVVVNLLTGRRTTL
jgi:hypothetical protein